MTDKLTEESDLYEEPKGPPEETIENLLYNLGKTGLEFYVAPPVAKGVAKGASVLQQAFKGLKRSSGKQKQLPGKQKQLPEKPFNPIRDYWGRYFPWVLNVGEQVADYINLDEFTEEQQKAISQKQFFPERQVHVTKPTETYLLKFQPYTTGSFLEGNPDDPGYQKAVENRDKLNALKRYFNNIEGLGENERYLINPEKSLQYATDTQRTLDTIYFKTVNPRIDGRRELRQLIMKAIQRLTPNVITGELNLSSLRFKQQFVKLPYGQQDIRTINPDYYGPLNKAQFLAKAALQPPTNPELDYKYEGQEKTHLTKLWDNLTGRMGGKGAIGYLSELLEITSSQEKYEKEMFKYTKDVTGRVIPYSMIHKPPQWSKDRWDEWRLYHEPWKLHSSNIKRFFRPIEKSGAIYFGDTEHSANIAAQATSYSGDILNLPYKFASRWLRAFPGEKEVREERAKHLTRLNPLGRQPTPSHTAVPYELSWDFLADNHRTFKRFLNSALDGENARWMNLSTQDDIVNFLSQLNFPIYFQDKYDPDDPKIWDHARQEEKDYANYSPEEIREYFRNPPKPGELEIGSPSYKGREDLQTTRKEIAKRKELEKYRHITRGIHLMLNEYHTVQAMYNKDKVQTMEMWLGGDINGRNPHLPTWINDGKELPDTITYPQLLKINRRIMDLEKADIEPYLKEFNSKLPKGEKKIHIEAINFPYLQNVLRMNLNLMYGQHIPRSSAASEERPESLTIQDYKFVSPFSAERYASILKPNWWSQEFINHQWIKESDYNKLIFKDKQSDMPIGMNITQTDPRFPPRELRMLNEKEIKKFPEIFDASARLLPPNKIFNALKKRLQRLNKLTATKNTLITREAIPSISREIAHEIDFIDSTGDAEGLLPRWQTFEEKRLPPPPGISQDKWAENKFRKQQTIKFLGFSGSRTIDEAGISTAMVDMNQIKDPKAKTQKFDTSRGAVHRASIPASILALMTGAYLTKKQMDELDRLEKEGQGKPVKRKRKGKRNRNERRN